MKKFMIPFIVFLAIVIAFGCKKNSPAAPSSTNTPNYTETYMALHSQTPTTTRTITKTTTITPTSTITSTSTITPTITTTPTFTNTPTPIASYTDLVSVPGGIITQSDFSANTFSDTISAFKIGKYQVTYDLWYKVYQWAVANGYVFQNAGAEGSNGTAGAAPTAAKYQPVTTINWRDAIVWCNAFSQLTGLTPVYCSDAGFNAPIKDSTGGAYGSTTCSASGCFDDPYVKWNADGYRLPTAGEYKLAASYINGSSWTPDLYASGATADYTNIAATNVVAWDSDDSGGITQAVGGKAPNTLGIYDMSGNVQEWCWDWLGNYSTAAKTDYRGAPTGSQRFQLGGIYDQAAVYTIVGRFGGDSPQDAFPYYGFRFARTY